MQARKAHVPIHVPQRSSTEFLSMIENDEKPAKRLRTLVELVGLEPTTSSLRTMRSPN
jgi:hypothetical protein